MNLAAGLLALALIGTDASRAPSGVPIHYQVRVLEFDGPAWRGTSHESLTPVIRSGGTAVWTAPHELAARLQESARRTIGTPSLTALEDTEATVHTGTDRSYIADLKRHADGAVGHATALAYTPEIGHIEDGVALTVQGRWMDQGLLTRVRIDEQRLLAFINYNLTEQVQPKDPAQKPAEVVAQIQAPEVVTGRVEGEWLIPHDGLLVVSLGVSRLTAESEAGAMVERVVILEAARSNREAGVTPPAGPTAGIALPPLPIATSRLPMTATASASRPTMARTIVATATAARTATVNAHPGGAMPSLPDRTLPVAVTSEGEVVEPARPPVDPEPIDVSSEPRATPQFRSKSAPAPPPPDIDGPASSPAPGRDASAARVAGPKATIASLNLAGVPRTHHADATRAEAANDACCADGNTHDAAPALLDQVVAAVTQYAHSCEGEAEPVCIFEFQGQGDSGRVRVLIEADTAGRALLHRASGARGTTDPSARRASHATTQADPLPRHCCQASADVCPDERSTAPTATPDDDSARLDEPSAVRGMTLQLGGRPEGRNRVEGRLSLSFRVHRDDDAAPARSATDASPVLVGSDEATICPAAAGPLADCQDAPPPPSGRLFAIRSVVVASPTVMAGQAPRDPALRPVALVADEPGPKHRLIFGLSPIPVPPVFSADPLILRVPLGMHAMFEISRIDQGPSAGLHRLFGTW